MSIDVRVLLLLVSSRVHAAWPYCSTIVVNARTRNPENKGKTRNGVSDFLAFDGGPFANYGKRPFACKRMRDKSMRDAADLPSYFATTYIGRPCAGRRRPPFFPVEMWNVYGVRRHGRTRANNSSEASHNALFPGLARPHHLSVFKLVEVLVSFEATVAHDVAQVESGATKKQKSQPYATAASKPSTLIITRMPIPGGCFKGLRITT